MNDLEQSCFQEEINKPREKESRAISDPAIVRNLPSS